MRKRGERFLLSWVKLWIQKREVKAAGLSVLMGRRGKPWPTCCWEVWGVPSMAQGAGGGEASAHVLSRPAKACLDCGPYSFKVCQIASHSARCP